MIMIQNIKICYKNNKYHHNNNGDIFMINNKSYYKGYDFLNNNKRIHLRELLNPFEYNFESINKDKKNSDKIYKRSNCNKK